MIFEDSRKALYCDPNAFIQKCNKKDMCEPKKVVFQEPYESMPAFYMDNNFKKGNCECVRPKKEKSNNPDKNQCDCTSRQNKSSGFDLKTYLPFLSFFNKGRGMDLSQILGLFNNNSQNGNNSNPISMITSLLTNGGLGNILNIFAGEKKKNLRKKELKTTDFEIKNYTRVD